MIKVPYFLQLHQNSCGAATLQMVYKYYGLENIKQRDIFDRYKKLEPNGSGNFYITNEDMVLDARERGLSAELAQTDYSSEEGVLSLKEFIERGIPIIVCQQYTREQPDIGHFRVVLDIDDNYVYFHDPASGTGGNELKWSYEEFLNYWQPSGQNVKGGIFILISRL